MKPIKIKVSGLEIISNQSDSTDRFQIEKTIQISQDTRSGVAGSVEIVVDDNQIYEYHFDDDTVWIGDPGNIEEVFPGALDGKRSIEDPGTLVLPLSLPVAAGSSRAINGKKILLKMLKVFVRKKGKKIVDTIVREKATELENKSLAEGEGIFSLDRSFQMAKGEIPSGITSLLFIHGTASSTKGSFGEIAKGNNGSVPAVWQQIQALYPERVFAFEHRSLTKSPLENVLELVEKLPEAASLHLITQSRGGIVGDLLCRFAVANARDEKPFNKTETAFLEKSERKADLTLIEDITEKIKLKKITISKFIRVGCPAGGTTLASKRLDTWLNVIFNIAGYAAGAVAAPIVSAFKELVLATVETKDDPDVLPGLEPQNPESPICKVINNPDSGILIDVPVVIISGDNEFTFKWRGLVNILSNLFFLAQNDFVVNTSSMYKGPKRTPGRTAYFLDKGGDITHFNYFKNESTRSALFNALNTVGLNAPGFSLLPEKFAEGAELRNINITLSEGALHPVDVSGNRPILVLLPGIMGSNLTHNGEQLWLDFVRFAKGHLTDLDYSPGNNPKISANSVVGKSYTKLYKYLSSEYDVLVFPFDWRKDMQTNVELLNATLKELMKHNQTIRLVGHSMGGVLIRDFMVLYPETLSLLNDIPGFRILLLGSPLGGSFRIASVLFGEDDLIKMLALIDFKNTKKDLLEVFVKFPGILGLLPHTDGENDFGQFKTWDDMRQAHKDMSWPLPSVGSLDEFANYRDTILEKSASLDYSKVVYIAGLAAKGKQTVSGYKIEPVSTLFKKKRKLRFEETPRGDGSVTWDSGIPSRMLANKSVFYSSVTHGELANDESLFLAISEILKSGNTSLLSRQEPSVATRKLDDQPVIATRSLVTYELDQSRDGLLSSVLGLYNSDEKPTSSRLPIQVSVTHGDLRYAKNPILIGHFEHDGIWSAERAADRHLNDELSRRRSLGLYPGPVGTSLQVLSPEDSFFKGVIVLGLGLLGEHNERVLQSAVEQAVKQYLVSLIHKPKDCCKDIHDEAENASANSSDKDSEVKQEFGSTDNSADENVALSSLLIGSGYGGLSLDRALTAILTGVQSANVEIKNMYPVNYKQVSELEFIELFQDQALAAARTLRELEKQEENRTLFVRIERKLREAMGRQQRVNTGYSPSWWSRVTVRRYTDSDQVSELRKNGLYFGISTDAARIEERSLLTAGDEILSMLQEISDDNKRSPELAKTLFELLIPNDFKSLVKRQGNIIWQLDEHTANFPWELLQDNLENGKPLSINSGMVRQLASQNFRIQIKMATGNNVLIIADPQLKDKYYQLPNAAAEGGSVAQLLTDGGYNVLRDINGTSDTILRKMYVRPYKILHLAAHGVFEHGPSKTTGMLIGPDTFLTPAHINQMSDTPELVFVNCCYLGKTDARAEEFSQNRYRLAANIGTQLINNGVKAVVVTGWAVGDQAALLFANRFYEAMLGGDFFGSAVWKARKYVYDRFGDNDNTWGAYQCYGDPSYKLENRESQSNSGASVSIEFETDDVLEMELTNLLHQLDLGQGVQDFLGRIKAIESGLSSGQQNSGRIIELLAQVHFSLGNLSEAIEYYQKLKSLSVARYTVRALEQLCNLKVKLYVQRWRTNPRTAPQAIAGIQAVITELDQYLLIGDTAERHILRASAYKRLALISVTDVDKIKYYGKAADEYTQAQALIASEEKYYPLANSLLLNYVLLKKSGAKASSLKKDIEALDKEYERIKKRNRDDYWSQLALCELPLYLYLVADKESNTTKLISMAKNLKKTSGHHSNWSAIAEQLDFLTDLFGLLDNGVSGKNPKSDKSQKLELIRKLRDNII